MIINKSGITIRIKVANFRIMGRATQGVRLINLEKRNDEIASVCKVLSEVIEEEIVEDVEVSVEEASTDENPVVENPAEDTVTEIKEDTEN